MVLTLRLFCGPKNHAFLLGFQYFKCFVDDRLRAGDRAPGAGARQRRE